MFSLILATTRAGLGAFALSYLKIVSENVTVQALREAKITNYCIQQMMLSISIARNGKKESTTLTGRRIIQLGIKEPFQANITDVLLTWT